MIFIFNVFCQMFTVFVRKYFPSQCFDRLQVIIIYRCIRWRVNSIRSQAVFWFSIFFLKKKYNVYYFLTRSHDNNLNRSSTIYHKFDINLYTIILNVNIKYHHIPSLSEILWEKCNIIFIKIYSFKFSISKRNTYLTI